MDTNVLVSAFRSRHGASFEIFRRLRLGDWTAVVSNHLLFEYEEILKRQAPELGLSLKDVDELLNAICARAEEYPSCTAGNRFCATRMTSHSSN